VGGRPDSYLDGPIAVQISAENNGISKLSQSATSPLINRRVRQKKHIRQNNKSQAAIGTKGMFTEEHCNPEHEKSRNMITVNYETENTDKNGCSWARTMMKYNVKRLALPEPEEDLHGVSLT